jgi:hypothetical protein
MPPKLPHPPEASTCLPQASGRIQGLVCSPYPLPAREETRPAGPSVGCLFQLPENSVGCGLGSLASSCPPLRCCNLLSQPYFAPSAPQGQRTSPPPSSPSSLAPWEQTALPVPGILAKSWRAGAGEPNKSCLALGPCLQLPCPFS